MIWGTSYYPEITPEAEWERDLDNMQSAGLKVLRIIDFGWTSLEPREGHYTFDWLDRFLDLAMARRLSAVLCTPTAAPPPWLSTQYPQIMIQRRDGTRHSPGGRRDVDVDSEIYRHYSVAIATAMGERYGNHPAVIGWQIDNELLGPEGELPESHSLETTFRFRQYLKKIHGDVPTLNHRWCLRFWSQEYSDWGEVPTIMNSRSALGHVFDYSRYFSESQRVFLKLQYDALRAVIHKRQWVSHNSTAVFDRGLEHADWAQELDVCGWDAYFGAAGRPNPEAFAGMAHDLFRSAKQKPFWIFETNPLNHDMTPAYAAEMRARGGIGAIFWHWRCVPGNAENQSDTVCDYAGKPDQKRIERLSKWIKNPALNASLPESYAPRPAALLFAMDCVRPRLTPDPYMQRGLTNRLAYLRVMCEAWKRCAEHALPLDMRRPTQTLNDLKLLILPACRFLSDAFLEQTAKFVEAGGVLVSIAHTGLQDEWGVFRTPMGGRLAEVLGIAVHRAVECRDTEGPSVKLADGQTVTSLPLVQPFELQGAEATAWFTDGRPAASRHQFGKGFSFHIAPLCLPLLSQTLLAAGKAAGLALRADRHDNVFHLPNPSGHRWVFNHTDEAVDIDGVSVAAKDFDYR